MIIPQTASTLRNRHPGVPMEIAEYSTSKIHFFWHYNECWIKRVPFDKFLTFDDVETEHGKNYLFGGKFY